MELQTKKMLIDGIASKWRKQYFRKGAWYDSNKKEIYETLLKLDNPSEDEVTKAIGNGYWTKNKCNECEEDVFATVVVGEPLSYDSYTAYLCPQCLRKALDIVSGAIDEVK